MPNTTHAFLVAINNYDPQSKIKNLRGCLNDLESVRSLLIDQYECAPENIKTLTNQEATRKAIITTFQNHLCTNPSIDAGDTVLFYFSGHGSYAKTAPEFEPFDAQQQDETLVCYDSRILAAGHYDLTDKEIAVLLSRVKLDVEIVVIVDACHSDSITRDGEHEQQEDLMARQAPQRTSPRTLSSYLLPEDDFYTKMQDITIPQRQHIVFSACTREQKAWEKNKQGVFTKHLLKVLQNTKGEVSYRQLHERVNFSVRQDVANQYPQIFVSDNFDIYKIFLRPGRIDGIPPFKVKYSNGQWRLINHGAIYGLRTEAPFIKSMRVAIYRPLEKGATERVHVGNVKVDAVKLSECHLDAALFEKEYAKKLAPLSEYASAAQKARPIFEAEIISVIPNCYIYLNGSPDQQDKFLQHWNPEDTPFIQFEKTLDDCNYELVFSKEQFLIRDLKTGELIHGALRNSKDSTERAVILDYIIKKIEQIEIWERVRKLENKQTSLDPSKVAVRFLEEGEMRYYDTPEINLNFTGKKILFQIQARNVSGKDLYVALIHLTPKYGIENFYTCKKFRSDNTDWITLDKKHFLDIPEAKKASVTDVFKIIISTEAFDDYQFIRESIEIGKIVDVFDEEVFRDTGERKDINNSAESDWFTHTITTHLIKHKQELDDTDTHINGLAFKGHPSFNAKIGFASGNTRTKDTHPAHHLFEIFGSPPFEIIDFDPLVNQQGHYDQSIIHLKDVENEITLSNAPLQFDIDTALVGDQNCILPITYDGAHFLPIGEIQEKEQQAVVTIQDLPVSEAPYLEKEEQTRSVPRALWFCVLKFAGYTSDAFRLKYIWKYDNKQPIYGNLSTAEIREKVAKADKIVLLIHGIIGNTTNIATAVQPLLEEGPYSLALTFDYENLNTPIETIAEKLHEALNAIGLDINSPKRIDVVAHSMGGLVTRYLIERIRKEHPLVDKLLLFGTPNGGSAFSNMTKLRDAATGMLFLAANGSKFLLPVIAPWLYGVNGLIGSTKLLSPTLAQMHPESPFIKGMKYNDLQPATQYHIVAGNFDKYQPTGNWLAGLIEKMTTTSLSHVYKSTASDLVVSVAQIFDVPKGDNVQTYEIGGYHMNYFEGEGVEILEDILG